MRADAPGRANTPRGGGGRAVRAIVRVRTNRANA